MFTRIYMNYVNIFADFNYFRHNTLEFDSHFWLYNTCINNTQVLFGKILNKDEEGRILYVNTC